MQYNPAIFEEENRLLTALANSEYLQQKLRTCTEEDLRVGLCLYYKLGKAYGCHLIREGGYAADPETKEPLNDFRGATKAGRFFILDN